MARRRRSIGAVSRLAYWREADARVVVDAWRRSGQRRPVFAAEHGIDVRRLERWVTRLRASATARVRFHPVRVVPTAPVRPPGSSPSVPLELIFPDGRLVRIPPGVAPADLRAVLQILADAPTRC